jgi:type II secretory pathway component PulF
MLFCQAQPQHKLTVYLSLDLLNLQCAQPRQQAVTRSLRGSLIKGQSHALVALSVDAVTTRGFIAVACLLWYQRRARQNTTE